MTKNNRVSLSERLKSNPMNELFKNTEDPQAKTMPAEAASEVDSEAVSVVAHACRKTYILTDELSKAVGIYASITGMDKSEIVRNAISQYVPEEFIEMAKMK